MIVLCIYVHLSTYLLIGLCWPFNVMKCFVHWIGWGRRRQTRNMIVFFTQYKHTPQPASLILLAR